MRFHATAFLTMWLKAAIELIIAFPIIFLLHYWLIPMNMLIWIVILIAFYSMGYIASAWLQLNKWYSLGLTGLFISGIIIYLSIGLNLSGIATGLLGFYLFFRGTFIAKRAWFTVFPIPFYWMGLACYFIESVFFRLLPEMRMYSPLLFWLGLLSVTITLLLTSQERIIQESLPEKNGRHLVNKKQLWQSRFLSIVILLIIALIAGIRQLAEGLVWLNDKFWDFVRYLAALISELFSTNGIEDPAPPEVQEAPTPLPPAAEPSAFMVWLEKIIYVVFIVILCAVALYLIYFVGKKVIRLIKFLYGRFKKRLNENEGIQAGGFEDESSSLTTVGELIKSYSNKVTDWLEQLRKREVKWEELTSNKEKIRFLYRLVVIRSLRKGSKVATHLTAQEMISTIQQKAAEQSQDHNKLVALYNQARYSKHPIEDEETLKLSKALKPE